METGHASGRSPALVEQLWEQLEPAYGWHDLILPDHELERLRALSPELRERARAPSSEGARGRKPGLRLLFAGGAGTGKTTAARILGVELGSTIFRVGLLSVLSGDADQARELAERLFAAGRKSGAILFLDQADTLLRTRRRDARSGERIAAIEAARLIERSGTYPGIVIFASRVTPRNEALLERFDSVIEFPFPEIDARKEIWRLRLPADARVGEPELEFLATSFKLPGGTIESCCRRASADAAQEGVATQMRHVGRALTQEYRRWAVSQSTRQALDQLSSRSELLTGGPGGAPPAPSQPPTRPPAEEARRSSPARAREPEPPSRAPAVEPEPPSRARAMEPEPPSRAPAMEPEPPSQAPAMEPEPPSQAPAMEPEPPSRAPAEEPRRRSRARPPAALIALLGIPIAALLGFMLAQGSGSHPTRAALDRHASTGSVQIDYPTDWGRRTPRLAPPLGLTDELALGPATPSDAQLVVGSAGAGDLPQLPEPLLASFAGAPSAQIVTLGGIRFYRYLNPSLRGGGAPESIYALPTTGGAVIGVCTTPHGDSAFTSSCERILGTIRLTSGRVLALGPSVSYAAGLDRVIGKLNAVRRTAGAQLRSAHGAQGQAEAADRLALAHEAAASALVQIDAGSATAANGAVATALRTTGTAYAALSRAAAHADAAGYRNASASIMRATTALNSALARLGQLGYRVG